MFSTMGLWVLRGLGYLPLSWLRTLGVGLGRVLWWGIPSRRRVVQTNLQVCFPSWTQAARDALARDTFVYFAQALSLIHI